MSGDDDVRSQASNLAKKLDQSEDEQELKEIAQQLIPIMIAYWDLHPHSAMEMLEYATMRLPLSLSHAFVRKVVAGWRQKASYDAGAGGGAGHCYLSALILSENFELAEHPWVDRVLAYTLDKELKYRQFDQMRDGVRREAIVRGVAASTGD